MRKKIVSVCGDPGGAKALLPVLQALTRRGFYLENYAYYLATNLLREAGLEVTELPKQVDPSKVEKILQEGKTDFLLTATSHNDWNWEKLFLVKSKGEGIRALTVLDYWSNYRLRFSDDQGELIYLPHVISVMDELAKKEMMSEGFPAECLWVTGQPAFDGLREKAETFSYDERQQIRRRLLTHSDEHLIFFVSQPIQAFYGGSLGFLESEVLSDLLSALDEFSEKYKKFLTVLVRRHPREESSGCLKGSRYIRVQLDTTKDPHPLIMSCDLVVGMNSVLLAEACLLKAKVLSYQPNLSTKDTLALNALGYTTAIYQKAELRQELEKTLLEERSSKIEYSSQGAVDKICEYISTVCMRAT